MKAITLWQPWASLIAEGVKTIETRPKQHPWRSAIGQTIAIHAAMRQPETMQFADSWWCERTWGNEFALLDDGGNPHHLPLGAVVATCTLVDVVPMLALTDEPAPPDELDVMPDRLLLWREAMPTDVTDQRPFGDFAPGRWALLLDGIERLREPFPCRGFQGLWTVPPNVESMVTSVSSLP